MMGLNAGGRCPQNALKARKNFWYSLLVLGMIGAIGQGHTVLGQTVTSRDTIALQNQIAALKSHLAQLQQNQANPENSFRLSSSDNDGSTNGLLPDLLNRVNTLEDQQRIMRGQLDDLTNQFQSKIDELSKKIDDKNFATGVSGAPTNPTPHTNDASSSTPAAQKSTLQDGQQALLDGDYGKAESIARSLMSSGQGARSVNAHFLLAQALAGQKRYKEASVGYFDIFRKFPNSARAPEALLGVSITMIKNNKNKEACQALALLKGKYPAASPRVKSAASTLHTKAHCS